MTAGKPCLRYSTVSLNIATSEQKNGFSDQLSFDCTNGDEDALHPISLGELKTAAWLCRRYQSSNKYDMLTLSIL